MCTVFLIKRSTAFRWLGSTCLLLVGWNAGIARLGAEEPRSSVREKLHLLVRETAGIRRFGYPVSVPLVLASAVDEATPFRLLLNDEPISAQFRPAPGDGAQQEWWLDFDINLLPGEEREFQVEYGDSVEPAAPSSGMQVHAQGESLTVEYSSQLSFTLRKDLGGLLTSVATPQGDYLRADSSGLFVMDHRGQRQSVGGGAAGDSKVRIMRQGPLATALRWQGAVQVGDETLQAQVDLEFPRPKSWVRVDLSIDDPHSAVAAFGAELNLNLHVAAEETTPRPTLVDFGAASLVYAALPQEPVTTALFQAGPHDDSSHEAGSTNEPAWRILVGPADSREPFVVGKPRSPGALPPDGWAHVMDTKRCTAYAVADFGRATRDEILVRSDGQLMVSRGGTSMADTSKPDGKSGRKTLTFWLHFVDFPAHVGAVTSPQSMLAPLEVLVQPARARP